MNYEADYYAVFYSSVLLTLSQAKIYSSASYSGTSSICVLLVLQIKVYLLPLL
jgi:hypothetical protein